MEKRVIKFREWNGIEMEYEPPFSMYSSASINERFMDNDVMQYTGIKDLKGKEIYEGDIVEFMSKDCDGNVTQNIFEVIYKAPEFKLKSINAGIFIKDAEVYFHQEVMVIGNIYENN